ncbi:MAG TPA: prepilin-type N-terminal cleavage/methylation domain-containing protein [Ilumatobacteraceae bacterium]|nr:prepilin-type N-terminal cleavage/methylation domain-containing protein [Ilumatobacteraceae bacterium]HUV19210.1 prepilin-type N-terminal cleavage/methylation domain-containing protein [Ilumatobacteraceae bacterium]
MSDRASSLTRARRDGGFTLIEILIVVAMIGFLTATLASVFTVIVRTTPDADARVTDARSLKGLVTWIPQDMDAAPPTGFDDSHSAWGCAGAAPADSHNVIAMSWTEVGDVTSSFHASYRYEFRNGEWVIARYSCQDGGTARRVNMTSELPPWNSSSPPAWVEMCSTPIDAATGDCLPASVVTDPTTQPVESMKVTLTLLDGTPYTIDAAAKNPDENLADDPDAVTNYPPAAGVPTRSITMLAGETRVLDLYAEHAISDPEGNFLTSAVDSYEPMPAGITVKSSDPLVATITADPLMGPGVLPDPVSMIVSDAYGGSVDVLIAIEIVLPPNDPPVAAISDYYLTVSENETIVLPLDLSHGISDPNGDGLSLNVLSWPAPFANQPNVGGLFGDLGMEITVKPGTAPAVVPDPIVTRVTDDRGDWIDVRTFLTIVAPAGNSAPLVTPFGSPAASIEAGDTVTLTVGATDPDGDLVWTFLDPGFSVPAGLTVTTSGLDVVVEADESIVAGTYIITLLVKDWSGATAPVTATIAIVPPPPPPPSPCVLGTLTVDQNPVGRAGSGGGPKALDRDVLVTLTYSGTCDGLVLKYDTGHPSGLGTGVGRVFPSGSTTSVELRGNGSGGSEKWIAGTHVLTASTTSAVTPNSVSITLTVN